MKTAQVLLSLLSEQLREERQPVEGQVLGYPGAGSQH